MVKQGCAFHLCGVGGLEPQTIHLLKLAKTEHPGCKWHDLTSRQQADLLRRALKPSQHLLHPHSPYLRQWDVIVLFALLFTALVTPYEVAFLHTKLNALFVFNCFIDLIFLKDMLMNFFLKVQVQSLQGTVWIRDRKDISQRYLQTWFVCDFISIMPFNILGLLVDNESVQKLKVVRVVRLMRLLKLVRILRASRIMKRLLERNLLSFATLGLIKFATLLLVISHWTACLWGLTGVLLFEDLKCDKHDLMKYEIHETHDGGSWIGAKSWGHHSPCEPFDVYLASLHFAVMTITSIGYGDITPTRNEEYIVGILCQLGGGLTWACIIGSICSLISKSNPVQEEFEHSMDALNLMFKEQKVDEELCLKLRDFVREKQHHDYLCRSRAISENFSPVLLTKLIPQTVIGKAIKAIWYFRSANQPFITEVASALVATQYYKDDRIGQKGVLSIVQRGSIARHSRILCPGLLWGEDMILSDEELIDPTQGIALNAAEILALSKLHLDQILVEHPEMESQIRKAATLISFRIAVKTVAKERKRGQMKSTRFHKAFNGIRVHENAEVTSPKHFKEARRISCNKLIRMVDSENDNGSPGVPLKPQEAPALVELGGFEVANERQWLNNHSEGNSVQTPDLLVEVATGLKGVMMEISKLKEGQDRVRQEISSLKAGQEDIRKQLRHRTDWPATQEAPHVMVSV